MSGHPQGAGQEPICRLGMTLTEVLMALALFMVGSVSLVGLFTSACWLHREATDRMTAAMIANELLAEVGIKPFREVCATTTIGAGGHPGGWSMDLTRVSPDIDSPTACFDRYPMPDHRVVRINGPLLIEGEEGPPHRESEWLWYSDMDIANNRILISPGDRGAFRCRLGGLGRPHAAGSRVMQPRTWYYVVADDPAMLATATTVSVFRDPADAPPLPSNYIVIDQEWMRFESQVGLSFVGLSRGLGATKATAHQRGEPVTPAREHPHHPGYFYTVQFFPANARGAESTVVVSVAYGQGDRMRAHFFHTIYSPSSQ